MSVLFFNLKDSAFCLLQVHKSHQIFLFTLISFQSEPADEYQKNNNTNKLIINSFNKKRFKHL